MNDGANKITSIFNINFCTPSYRVGEAEFIDRAPEFVTVSDTGAVTRTYRDVTIECHYLDTCSYDLYAAHFRFS